MIWKGKQDNEGVIWEVGGRHWMNGLSREKACVVDACDDRDKEISASDNDCNRESNGVLCLLCTRAIYYRCRVL